ncbi:MAG: hypothetical protein HC802_19945, partial [Caldilineaceae bacterium]|nr:hypothetical protein [Caldilineaceae bacterium]
MQNQIELVIQRGIEAAERDYDPDRHLVSQPSAKEPGQRTYRQAASLPYARALLQRGDAESVARAAEIVAAVLESQELSPGHPYVGNWLWLADDPEIADLNAVQFVLRGLLPILVLHERQLPEKLVELCRERVRLALAEEERLDVAPTYTNIHLMSLQALIVGGEWLQDGYFLELGRTRWQRWVKFTVRSGAPHEYNSPVYSGVDLATLSNIQLLTRDPAIKLQARLMYERFCLHFALHMHRPTRQNAGPHCRSYWPNMVTGHGALHHALWLMTGWSWLLEAGPYGGESANVAELELALTAQEMPDYIVSWLEHQSAMMPYEVRETANVDQGFDLTTYFTPEYALGSASKTYGIGTDCFYIEHQSNYLMLHYARPNQPGGWGMMYTRYVVNEQHWGTLGAAPDRPKTANFYDQGHFAGVQLHNKAIGLYALKPQHEEVHSLKTVVAFQSGNALERVWINEAARLRAAAGPVGDRIAGRRRRSRRGPGPRRQLLVREPRRSRWSRRLQPAVRPGRRR